MPRDDYIDSRLSAIVGFDIQVTSIEGKWKLSQNRSEPDIAGVISGLAARHEPGSDKWPARWPPSRVALLTTGPGPRGGRSRTDRRPRLTPGEAGPLPFRAGRTAGVKGEIERAHTTGTVEGWRRHRHGRPGRLAAGLPPAPLATDVELAALVHQPVPRRRGPGPLYWSTYGYNNSTNAAMPEELWKANVDWVAETFAPYGYRMVCTDGWLNTTTKVTEHGYIRTSRTTGSTTGPGGPST